MRIWNILNGICLIVFETNATVLEELSYDKYRWWNLVSSTNDKSLCVWNLVHKDFLRIETCHTRDILCLKNINKRLFASGSYDGTIKLWSQDSLKCIQTLYGHYGKVNSLEVSSCGEQIFSCSEDKSIRIWSLALKNCSRILTFNFENVRNLKFNSYTGELFSVSLDNNNANHVVNVWDIDKGICVKTYKVNSYIQSIEFCTVLW